MITFRKAQQADIPAVTDIYHEILDREERGEMTIGWQRGVYPTQQTAQAALSRGDLFVETDEDVVTGAAIINQIQVPSYAQGNWRYAASDDEVMVLHTLVISPCAARRGYGKAFVAFYEDYARRNGCPYLRMDTNARNQAARHLYKTLGYEETGIVPTVFNGIPGVNLVLLEKKLK